MGPDHIGYIHICIRYIIKKCLVENCLAENCLVESWALYKEISKLIEAQGFNSERARTGLSTI